MPTKLGKGGHGHEKYDKNTGKYVEDGGGFDDKDKKINAFSKIVENRKSVTLKPGVNLQDLLKKMEAKKNGALSMPVSLADAMEQGNRILGHNGVVYSPETHLEAAHSANIALKDVKKDFPEAFNGLIKFGTGSFNKTEADTVFSAVYKNLEEDLFKRFKMFEQQTGQLNYVSTYSDRANVLISYLSDKAAAVARKEAGVGDLGLCSSQGFVPYGEKTRFVISSVSFNRSWFSMNVINGDKELKDSLDTNYHFGALDGKSQFYATATHELGHRVDMFLGDFLDQKPIIDICKKRFALRDSGELSGYTCEYKEFERSYREMVAEAFSDWYCRGEKATETNKKIFKAYKQTYDQHYGSQK